MVVQQTPEWTALRKKKIGASDAPIIMGISPWKTPYKLWSQKVGLEEEDEPNEAMKRGLGMEEFARQSFEKQMSLIVFPEVLMHPKYKWMMASLDGIDVERKVIVEVKCAGKTDHSLAKEGKIPEKYFPQLQHQLEVSGLEMAYYYSFDGQEGVCLECKKDPEYIEKMVEKEQEFYRCMESFSPPSLTDRDYEIREDSLWIAYSEKWMEAKKALVLAEKRESQTREALIGMIEGKNTKGSGICITKIARKGVIDYSKISEIKNVDLEKYRKDPTEFWRITEEKKG